MSEPRHEFDETSISGYLDGELTQRDDQRVRLHLEDCAECRAIADGMRKMKEATMMKRKDRIGEVRPRTVLELPVPPRTVMARLFKMT